MYLATGEAVANTPGVRVVDTRIERLGAWKK